MNFTKDLLEFPNVFSPYFDLDSVQREIIHDVYYSLLLNERTQVWRSATK